MRSSALLGYDDMMWRRRLFGFIALLAWMDIFGHWRARMVDGLTLAPVYWNSSNPMFKPSINSPVIEVQLRDEIDFVCPFDDSNGSDVTSAEYYVIYQVTQQEYDSCSLSTEGRRRPLLIVNCNAPEAKRRFTVIFEPYQSIPNVPEYKTGGVYYYTTTSSGKQSGLSNTKNGACQDYNMKLAIFICCPTTVTLRTTIPSLSSMSTTTTTTSSQSLGQRTPSASENSAVDFRPSQPTATSRQLTNPFPRISGTSTSTSTASSTTSTSTSSTVRTNADPTPSRKTNAVSSTTKITRFPQPSYQQTADGCGRLPPNRPLALTAAAAAAAVTALMLSFYGRT